MVSTNHCERRLKMKTMNELAELRRLVQQAERQIEAQLAMIDGLMRLGIPAHMAEDVLSRTRRLASELQGRLKVLTAA